MRVSIVIPTLSRVELLREALRSVARQSHRSWELVVVDDGSIPPLLASQISEIVGDDFQLLRHPQTLGTAAAKNTGVAAAKGDLITILDDDDLLMPDALQSIVAAFTAHGALDCLFINIEPFGRHAPVALENQGIALNTVISNAASHREGDVIFFGPDLFRTLLITTPIALQRPVLRPRAWHLVGGFTPGIICPESTWAARAALLLATALLVKPIYRWRFDGQNFASRPAMRAVATLSILNDRVGLLRSLADGGSANRQAMQVLRESIGTLMLDRAADLLVTGHRLAALRQLIGSIRYAADRRSIKMAVRLLLPASFGTDLPA